MKANELMIGDWVEFTSKYDCGTGQIAAIEPMEGTADPTTFSIIKNKQDGSHFYVGVSKNGVRPISLTAEILEKNGFESTPAPSERVWKDNGQEVWLDNEGKNYWANIKNGEFYFEGYIEHTHELQHCLKLVGINKEIIL